MSERPLRIVLAVWVHEAGLPHRGSTFEHAHFLPALRSMGCEVVVFDLARTRGVGPAQTTVELERLVTELEPDLVFCSLFEDDLDAAHMTRLSERFVTYNWFADDHWRFERFSQRWAPAFRWVSTTDSEAVERYASVGVHHVLLTQWAASTEVYAPQGRPLVHEVTFVGQVYGDRRTVIDDLRRNGANVETWGTGWAVKNRHRVAGRAPLIRQLGGAQWAERVRASTRLDLIGMVAVFEQSRINLNLADSSHGSRQQIKGRVFEVPACGGFLLTQEADRLSEFLIPGEEVATFSTRQDLEEQVKHWLTHEQERRDVAARGLSRVRRDHTYERRFTDLFHAMGLRRFTS